MIHYVLLKGKSMSKNTNRINRIGGLYGQVTRWGVFDKEHIAPTITAAMGQGEVTFQ